MTRPTDIIPAKMAHALALAMNYRDLRKQHVLNLETQKRALEKHFPGYNDLRRNLTLTDEQQAFAENICRAIAMDCPAWESVFTARRQAVDAALDLFSAMGKQTKVRNHAGIVEALRKHIDDGDWQNVSDGLIFWLLDGLEGSISKGADVNNRLCEESKAWIAEF